MFEFRVDPQEQIRDAALNASPYLLMAVWLLFMMMIVGIPENGTSTSWQIARWALRLFNVGVALWAWKATDEQRYRPNWVLGWLGFALYELVGVGLLATAFVSSSDWLHGIAGLLILPIIVLAFLPWIIGSTRLATQDQKSARFTVFSHAALTAPLFLAAVELWPSANEISLYWSVLAMLIVAATVAALYELLTPKLQNTLLYSGVVLCQSLCGLLLAFQGIGLLSIIAAVILSVLGLVVLSCPFVLAMAWATLLDFLHKHALIKNWRKNLIPSVMTLSTVQSQSVRKGEKLMSETPEAVPNPTEEPVAQSPKAKNPPPSIPPRRPAGPGFDRLFRISIIVLALFAIGTLVTMVGRSAVYKIHEYERGLHLRGGRFLGVQLPGWHLQIPLVDTVIIVKTNERLGYVERIPAMTSDNVTMIVSLQYTYKVTDPEQFALQVDDPERIVFEFVQGKLRDVVNTKAMADVMNNRVIMNDEVMTEMKEKESQYGVQFVTVQLQSASPPDEVLTAIKDRMVASQRQEQAQAEAAQKKTQADAELYAAQTRAEAEAYQITKTAEAQAASVRLMTEAQQLSIRSIVAELDGKGALGEKYIDYLIAQQLKDNSKWVINGDSTPILDLR